jgi:SAM-dependent methyltransferase
MGTKAYTEDRNSEQYTRSAGVLDEYSPSEQFGIVKGIAPGNSVLDIGCNNGRLYNAANLVHGNLSYTGIDMDARALELAKEKYPEIEVINDVYPSEKIKGKQFDVVTMYAVFQLLKGWKNVLNNLASNAKSKIVLDLAMTMDFPTIDDIDLSYIYYLDSGERVSYTILNVIQFVNYCFTENVNASSVHIMATNPATTTSLAGLPRESLLRGVAIIEKDLSGKPIWGAQSRVANPSFMDTVDPKDFRLPEATIDIDGKNIQLYPCPGIF